MRLSGFHAHDELLQLLALILANHVAAQRGQFHRDFFFGHGIVRIALGNIDSCGRLLPVIGRDRDATVSNKSKSGFTAARTSEHTGAP